MTVTTTTRATSLEQQALDAVDERRLVELTSELLAVPSVSGSDAECEIQHLLARRVIELGLDVDLWPLDLDALAAEPGFPGVEVARREGWGLVARAPGRDPDRRPDVALVLQGHVDVVPTGDLAIWATPPFTPARRGGRLHARGACDMKAGVAANLAALEAILRAGIKLREDCALHFVIGEEDGGLGAFATLRRGHMGLACVITEPTSGTLVTANAGALGFSIEVPGLATHGSTPYAGASALAGFLHVHRALERLEARRNRGPEPLMAEYPVPYPISIGRVRAGDWASSVPDLLIAEGRLGLRIGEEPTEARAEFEGAVAAACRRHGFLGEHPARVRWSGGQYAGGATTPGHPLIGRVHDAHADVTGRRMRERGAPYGSDLRLYEAGGIPTLHYGPGDVRLAHGPNESVDVSELADVTRALVLTLIRTCGTH